MSLLPYLLDELDPWRPSRILDQHFGLGLIPEDLLQPSTFPSTFRNYLRNPYPPSYYRPWRTVASAGDAGSTITADKDKFQVRLDVQQFAPSEINVYSSGNNTITVEGKHEEKQDEHGYISRHFVRRYVIPKGHDVERAVSTLSSDGVLTIMAPAVDSKQSEQRNIPITQTGAPSKAPPETNKDCGDKKNH